MEMPKYECLRCGYHWIPRTEKHPITCPNDKCRSPYWDRPRKNKLVKKDEKLKGEDRSVSERGK